jgi:hypothetical protein
MSFTVTPNPRASSGYPAIEFAPTGVNKAGYDWVASGSSYYPRLRDIAGNRMGFTGWLPSVVAEQVLLVRRTVTITSAAAATPISIVGDSEVPSGYTFFLTGFVARVNGTTGWGTTSTVKIQDTNASAVDFVTFAVAGLTNQARLVPGTANVTLEDAYSLGTGGTASKGLQIVGNANGTGSDFVVTVHGYYKKSS